VVISKYPNFLAGEDPLANPVNKMAAWLTCTDSTTCSYHKKTNDNLYENPEI